MKKYIKEGIKNVRPERRPRFNAIWLLPLLMFAGLAVLLGSRLGHDPSIVPLATNTKPLPMFELPELSSKRIYKNVDLPKAPFLLNVWGSWCPTCIEENPKLLQLAQDGIFVVGMDYKDQPEDAEAYLAKHGNPYQLILQDIDGRYGVDLGVTGAPETYVVDGNGIIRQHIVGVISEDVWQEKIKPCLTALKSISTQQQGQPVIGVASCVAS